MLLVGEVPRDAVPRILSSPDETNELKVRAQSAFLPLLVSLTPTVSQHGEVIVAWNYLFTWNERYCLTANDFEPYVVRHLTCVRPLTRVPPLHYTY